MAHIQVPDVKTHRTWLTIEQLTARPGVGVVGHTLIQDNAWPLTVRASAARAHCSLPTYPDPTELREI